jgi:hypothetical protein
MFRSLSAGLNIPNILNTQKRTYGSGYCTSVKKNLKVVLESSTRNWWHVSEPLNRVKYTQYSKCTKSELTGLAIALQFKRPEQY